MSKRTFFIYIRTFYEVIFFFKNKEGKQKIRTTNVCSVY